MSQVLEREVAEEQEKQRPNSSPSSSAKLDSDVASAKGSRELAVDAKEQPSSGRAASVSSGAVGSAKKRSGIRKPKKGSKAAKRARALRAHRAVRWAIQLAFFILAPSVFSAAFNGIKYVAGQIGLMQAVEPTSFVVLLVGVLLFTVVFGRFFCGYACAFGTLGDAVYALFTPVRKVLHIPDFPLPQKVQRGLQFVKFGILAAICALCFTGAWQAISGYSPWTAFAGIVAGSVDGISTVAFIVLGVIVLGMALVKRFFCQFLCPLGAVFALLPVLPVSQFNRCAGRCGKRCGKCQAGCPVGIYPDGQSFAMGECISCGKCADVCPLTNIGMIRIVDTAAGAADGSAKATKASKTAGAAALASKAAFGAKAPANVKASANVAMLAGSTATGAKASAGAAALGGAKSSANVAASAHMKASASAKASGVAAASISATVSARVKASANAVSASARKKVLLRGNEIGFTLVKAALLLLLLWIVGALGFAPSFAETTGIQLPWA